MFKDTVSQGLRVLFKTAISAGAGWLTAKGIDVPTDWVLTTVGLAAGLANVIINGLAAAALTSGLPDSIKAAIQFLWAPPSYQSVQTVKRGGFEIN